MTTIQRCQASNPATCTDPNCPEKRGYRSAITNAARNNDYKAYENARNSQQRRNKSHIAPAEETLYHAEIGFPSNFREPSGVRPLEYSRHAIAASKDDRYGNMRLPGVINLDNFKLIELGVVDKGRRVSKMLYRGTLDANRDLCIVVIPKPQGQKWFVKTVWINEKSDAHRTLNRNKYANPMAA